MISIGYELEFLEIRLFTRPSKVKLKNLTGFRSSRFMLIYLPDILGTVIIGDFEIFLTPMN